MFMNRHRSREVGAGLQLANGTRLLFSLGLEQAVRRDGIETTDKVIRLWSTGQTVVTVRLDIRLTGGALRLSDVSHASGRPSCDSC